MTDQAARDFVAVFAEGWRAPTNANGVADYFEPWLHPQFRFNLLVVGGTLAGPEAFRKYFAPTIFEVLSEVHGTVESWACRDDLLFMELRIDAKIGSRSVVLHICERIVLREQLAIDRVTYVDPLPVLLTFLQVPRLWPRGIRAFARARCAVNRRL